MANKVLISLKEAAMNCKELQVPFVIYEKFESNLREAHKPNIDNADASYTNKYQKYLYVLMVDLVNQCKYIKVKIQFTSL